ncbi:MAG: hypothetical protein QW404_00005, partial [Candidatus Nanoarchaeia archaeon]
VGFKLKNPDSSFLYISRHRSHMDYIETQLALGKSSVPAMIQAGDNLFIGPFDPFWRELGAFMAIREGKGFYSKNWIKNMAFSIMKDMHLYKKDYEVYIDKKLSQILYESYLDSILSSDGPVKDLLLYPEYIKQPDGSTKYGRSYSGRLLDFSIYLFIVLNKIASKKHRKFFFVPVNPSYERVIEDSFMMKIPSLKKRFSKELVYLQEYAYILTRPLFPFFTRGSFVLKFGEPFELEISGKIKSDAKLQRNKLEYEVGRLETPFSPQVVFYSMQGERKVLLKSLEDRVMSNISKLEESKVDTSRLKAGGIAKSFDLILEETLRLFDAPGRRYTRIKDRSLEILDSTITSQYANHIAHLF